MPRLPRKVARRPRRQIPAQGRHPVPSVPHLPRKTKVDVRLCHACHAKWRNVCGDKVCGDKVCVNKVFVDKVCVDKVCGDKVCGDKVCVDKVCGDKVFVDKVCG